MRRVGDPLVRAERHRVDHVEDDVELAVAVLRVPLPRGAIDGQAAAAVISLFPLRRFKMSVSFKTALIPVLALALSLGFNCNASADALTENFDAGLPAGWTVNNLSAPKGSTDWF